MRGTWRWLVMMGLVAGVLVGCQGTSAASTGPDWAATVAAQGTRLARQGGTLEAQAAALATLQAAASATPSPTPAAPPATATPRPSPTATATPAATPTPAATTTSPSTGTSAAVHARPAAGGGARLTVAQETICRVGPDVVFYRLGVVRANEPVTVIGRWHEYWRVQLDDGTKCWIWGPEASLDRDPESVPWVIPGVGAIWGYVFTDADYDGVYRQGVDGRKGGTVVELYPATDGACVWTAEPLARTKVNGKGVYTFVFDLSKPTAYCVKAIFTDPTETACRANRVVAPQPGRPAQGDLYTIPCTGAGCTCP